MLTIAEEIRDGLDFLITQIKSASDHVGICADHDVFCASLYGEFRPCDVPIIQTRMLELNWHQGDDDDELQFRYIL